MARHSRHLAAPKGLINTAPDQEVCKEGEAQREQGHADGDERNSEHLEPDALTAEGEVTESDRRHRLDHEVGRRHDAQMRMGRRIDVCRADHRDGDNEQYGKGRNGKDEAFRIRAHHCPCPPFQIQGDRDRRRCRAVSDDTDPRTLELVGRAEDHHLVAGFDGVVPTRTTRDFASASGEDGDGNEVAEVASERLVEPLVLGHRHLHHSKALIGDDDLVRGLSEADLHK